MTMQAHDVTTGAEPTLVLTPPQSVEVVSSAQAASFVALEEGKAQALKQRAALYAGELAALAPNSPQLDAKVAEISRMGASQMRAASQVSNRMLSRPTAALAASRGQQEGSQESVLQSLVELRRTCEDLDPSRAEGSKRLLWMLPFRNKMKDYFSQYQSAQSHITKIIQALENGKRALERDNQDIESEKASLWQTMEQLQEYVSLAGALDQAVGLRASQMDVAQPQQALVLRSDILFAIRQKHQDLLTQMAVATQGYLALDMVRKNNIELIKGVERATTTTISALRTAVIVAQALTNQKLVLDQVTALHNVTGNIILATSEMLKEHSAQIQQRAITSSVSMDSLSMAFENVYATMDAVDQFKVQATENMANTVTALEGELLKTAGYMERTEPSTQ